VEVILLDTNAYAAFLQARHGTVEIVRSAATVFMSVFVIGELLAGFRNGKRFDENWRALRQFLDSPRVRYVPATIVTADRYSRVLFALRAKGRPLPANDVWIAAHAMEIGADLVSYDRHFGDVDGLAWTLPIDPET
jgi:tRNA(fMet)-specific endonuclease VapC